MPRIRALAPPATFCFRLPACPPRGEDEFVLPCCSPLRDLTGALTITQAPVDDSGGGAAGGAAGAGSSGDAH